MPENDQYDRNNVDGTNQIVSLADARGSVLVRHTETGWFLITESVYSI